MIIRSRKELKALLNWYDELKERNSKRKSISIIYNNYKTTTFNLNNK